MAKVGVMFVGLTGATASTVVGGSLKMASRCAPVQFGTTSRPAFASLGLVGPEEMSFGGWDFKKLSVGEAVRRHGILPPEVWEGVEDQLDIPPAAGVRTELDIPAESEDENYVCPTSFGSAVETVLEEIRAFRIGRQVSQVIVFYLGSPHKRGRRPLSSYTIGEIEALSEEDFLREVPSGLIYAIGAVRAGAHFIDFTPSETLECEAIDSLAEENHVQVAGRDGSTGQTMLKVTIAEMLRIRNLRLKSWYSTNILGNHDGYVLGLEGHDEIKLRDKSDVLGAVLGYHDFEHLVKIDFFQARGDRKECWDVVDCEGWLGQPVSLRLNWIGGDSLLAAPMILDLIRLIEYGGRKRFVGLQPQLGLFFKRPLATRSSRNLHRSRPESASAA